MTTRTTAVPVAALTHLIDTHQRKVDLSRQRAEDTTDPVIRAYATKVGDLHAEMVGDLNMLLSFQDPPARVRKGRAE